MKIIYIVKCIDVSDFSQHTYDIAFTSKKRVDRFCKDMNKKDNKNDIFWEYDDYRLNEEE